MMRNYINSNDFIEFSKGLAGEACCRTQAQYDDWHRQSQWNERRSQRFPDIIVRVKSVDDVVATVRYAGRMGLTIGVRSGGNSFPGAFLRNKGLLLDVSALRQLDFDVKTAQATIGPGVSSEALSRKLAPFGYGFPTGHAGNVGMAGFLLGGGLGINFGAWGGMGAFNIVALDVVTADGQLKHLSATENQDLYWAARGAGPGLFFAVVRFYLQCMPLPAVITTRSLRLHFSHLGTALTEIARVNPDRNLQLMLAVIPANQADRAEDFGREVMLTSIAFADSPDRATALHTAVIERLAPFAIEHAGAEQSTSFEAMHSQGKETFSSGRYRVDNILTDRPEDAVGILASHLPLQPSPDTLPLFIWRGAPTLADAAFSATGSFYFSTYARWYHEQDDEANKQWLIALYDELQAVAANCYINEFDLEVRSSEVNRCFSENAWQRLCELRRLHDPATVFHDFYLEQC